MTKISIVTIASIVILGFLALATENKEQRVYVMPVELVELAENNGLTQVVDFYSTHSNIEPPFLWGYDENIDKFESATFWCQKKGDTNTYGREYYLMFTSRQGVSRQLKIDKIIKSIRCCGLSFQVDTLLMLEEFVYVDDTTKHGPSGAITRRKAIIAECDGFGITYYKHKDNWLVKEDIDW